MCYAILIVLVLVLIAALVHLYKEAQDIIDGLIDEVNQAEEKHKHAVERCEYIDGKYNHWFANAKQLLSACETLTGENNKLKAMLAEREADCASEQDLHGYEGFASDSDDYVSSDKTAFMFDESDEIGFRPRRAR